MVHRCGCCGLGGIVVGGWGWRCATSWTQVGYEVACMCCAGVVGVHLVCKRGWGGVVMVVVVVGGGGSRTYKSRLTASPPPLTCTWSPKPLPPLPRTPSPAPLTSRCLLFQPAAQLLPHRGAVPARGPAGGAHGLRGGKAGGRGDLSACLPGSSGCPPSRITRAGGSASRKACKAPAQHALTGAGLAWWLAHDLPCRFLTPGWWSSILTRNRTTDYLIPCRSWTPGWWSSITRRNLPTDSRSCRGMGWAPQSTTQVSGVRAGRGRGERIGCTTLGGGPRYPNRFQAYTAVERCPSRCAHS